MKTKLFIRGLGVGIVLTTIILYLGKGTITDQDIINKAKELGMEMKDDSMSSLITNKPDDLRDPQDDKDDLEDSQDPQNGSDDLDDSQDKPDDLDSDAGPKEPENQVEDGKDDLEEQGKDEMVMINIEKGMLSSDVARVLYNARIIENEKEFDKYMIATQKSRKIRIGEYEIKKGETFENLVNIITRNR